MKERHTAPNGFALIEIVAAIAVLTLVLSSVLTSVLAIHSRLLAQGTRLADSSRAVGVGWEEHWGWGPQVRTANWAAGVLSLEVWYLVPRLITSENEALVVGVWRDGHLVEQRELEAPGLAAQIPLPVESVVETEVIVRVRRSEGAWGPPYRLVAGYLESTPSMPPEESGGVPKEPLEAFAHGAMMARARFQGWASMKVLSPAPSMQTLDGTLGLIELPAGVTRVEMGERAQEWKPAGARAFDVYF